MEAEDGTWTPATSPAEPRHQARSVVVEPAFLTRFNRAPMVVDDVPRAPRDWMTGAVHDADGWLVTASRRGWAGDRSAPVSVDPDWAVVPRRAPLLEGSWRYAGHWTTHIGHVVVELLPTLWGPPSDVRGLVLHRSYRGAAPLDRRDGARRPEVRPWQRDLLRLAGYPEAEVRVVRHRPLRVERLVVPSRPVLLKSWAAPEAVEVWQRVAVAAGRPGPDQRVFLSRRLFNATGASSRAQAHDPAWDEALEAEFAAAGFTVVHPETMPVVEQVRLVRGARVLAGAAGSALHLSAFARPGTRVLEVGDPRTPTSPLPTQRTVDAACGHLTAFVPYGDRRALDRVLGSLDRAPDTPAGRDGTPSRD